MPVPISRIPDNKKDSLSSIDYSFLLTMPEPKKTVLASNKDADLLFEIWSGGGSTNVAQKDVMRLKAMGFILTNNDGKVEFTKKGKVVITTMALGEESSFEKNSSPKKYTEILASMDKKNKTGYRIPKFATNNNNNLRLS